MNAVRGRGIATAALSTIALAAATLTAAAGAEASSVAVMVQVATLPQTQGGEVVPLADGRRVAIAGGAGAPVVIYDTTSSAVTTVSGSEGVTRLDLDRDHLRLTGAAPQAGRLVSIDLTDLTSTSWKVPGCPYDATRRGGSLFFVLTDQGCAPHRLSAGTLWALDPSTGNVAPASAQGELSAGIAAGSIVGVDDGSIITGGILGQVPSRRFSVAPGGSLTLTSSTTVLKPDVHLTSTRDRVFGSSGHSVVTVAADDLTDLDNPVYVEVSDSVWQVDGDHVVYDDLRIVDHSGEQVDIRSFDLPFAPLGVVLTPGGTLVATALVGGAVRLFELTDALTRARIDVFDPVPELGVGELGTIRGRVSATSVPPGARIHLVEADAPGVDVASAEVASGGLWSLDVRLNEPGDQDLELRYTDADGIVTLAPLNFWVLRHHRVLTLDGPYTYAAGEDVVVTGRVTDNGLPLAGEAVRIERAPTPAGYYGSELVGNLVTDSDGAFRVSGEGMSLDDFYYTAAVNDPDYGGRLTETVKVHVDREPVVITMDPLPTSVAAGEVFEAVVHVTYDGSPVAGARVQHLPPGYQSEVFALTDADGEATLPMSLTSNEKAVVWFVGSPRFTPASVTGAVSVLNNPSQISFTAPDSVLADDDYTVTGALQCAQPRQRTLTLSDGASSVSFATESDGTFSRAFSSMPGVDQITVSFAGDSLCGSAATSRAIEVKQRPTTIEAKTFDEAPLYQRTYVVARVLDAYFPARLLVDGKVVDQTFTGSYGYEPAGPVGSVHTIEIRYDGDRLHAPASRSWSVTTSVSQPTLTVRAPARVFPGTFIVNGILDAAPPGAAVNVTGPDGTRTATVDNGGYFQTTARVDSGAIGDTLSWTVRYDGDGATALPVSRTVVRGVVPVPVSVNLDRDTYHPGDTATLGIRSFQDHSTQLTVSFVGGSTFFSGSANAQVPAQIPISLTRTRVVRVSGTDYGLGGSQFGTFTVDVPIAVTRRLSTTVTGSSTRIGSYLVMSTGTNPRLRTRDLDPAPGLCLRTQVQRLSTTGTWRTVLTRACDKESSAGGIAFSYAGKRTAGDRFRARSYYAQDDRFEKSPSAWAYFRFR